MVFSRDDLPSTASIFSTYASMAGYFMMIKPMVHMILPQPVQNFVISYIKSLVGSRSSTLTLIINDLNVSESNGMRMRNELYYAAQAYLSSKISPDASKLRINRNPKNKNVNVYLSQGEIVTDIYKGIKLMWRYLVSSKKSTSTYELDGDIDECYFSLESLELSFDKKHRDFVLNSYIPYVEGTAKVIKNENRILKMHSYSSLNQRWESVNFEHPSTFDKMAMNEELKRSVKGDLDRFIKRQDFYKRVGKAWKRGYLLYGPPGTGKTSLVAAMANYLKFDIYDLQLASVQGDASLRRLLLGTNNRSILLVEDIDCSVDLPTRLQPTTMKTLNAPKGSTPLTLSGLLNCIDGLWSSCGDERIVIFTTNNKEKLDPALLRPGRMDMHIYMGHCGFDGFKTLASNYLGLSQENDDSHRLYPDIRGLLDGQVLTPAQVAEELMKSEDVDMALEGLVSVLKRKRSELDMCDDDDDESKKKMKKVEEGEKRVSEIEETLKRQVLTPTQGKDDEELTKEEEEEEDSTLMGQNLYIRLL